MKTPHEIINETGYPLQLYVSEAINSTQHQHGWHVMVQEHRWVNSESQDDGYIDIVLEHVSYVVRLIVECKRVRGSWTFLLPNRDPKLVYAAKFLHAKFPPPDVFKWETAHFKPESYDAPFCVMEVEGKKDSRTLEKIAGELLLSLESLAVEEARLLSSRNQHSGKKWYVPIIITTANLQVCLFDPKEISAEDGSIQDTQEIKQVDFIRFRKNLTGNSEFQNQKFDLKEAHLENERTVFVVQAKNITNFLQSLSILPMPNY